MFAKIIQSTANLASRPAYSFSIWANVPKAPADPVLGVAEAFKKDTDKNKVNLGVGAYRNNEGKPWVLDSVRRAEEIVYNSKMDNEYLPVEGLEMFRNGAAKLAYTENNKALKEGRIATVQSLSGTGAVRLGMDMVKRYFPEDTQVLLPKPTWPNHNNMAKEINLNLVEYTYYNPANKGLNLDGFINDLKRVPEKSVVLLHACAHNPTGCDPNPDQWKQLLEVFIEKKHVAFFDMAYQGFTSGDINKDSLALQFFANNGTVPIMLAQSFAKSFGLYGQRIGMFSTICDSAEQAQTVQSQIKSVARRSYSNPPLHGARIVGTILNTPELYDLWCKEVNIMSSRITDMRQALVDGLKSAGSTHDWTHITNQKGMFAYTGINQQQVERMRDDHHVYLTMDGRISIAGLNTGNVSYVANAFHQVSK